MSEEIIQEIEITPKPTEIRYPYVDEDGKEHFELIEHYRENGGKIICAQTGEIYIDNVIDLYPCEFDYFEYNDEIQEENNV